AAGAVGPDEEAQDALPVLGGRERTALAPLGPGRELELARERAAREEVRQPSTRSVEAVDLSRRRGHEQIPVRAARHPRGVGLKREAVFRDELEARAGRTGCLRAGRAGSADGTG